MISTRRVLPIHGKGIALISCLLITATAHAQTPTNWKNTGSDFSTGSNWSNGVGATLDGTLPATLSGSIVNPNVSGTFTIHSLFIDNSLGNYNITQTGSSTLILSGATAATINDGITTIDPLVNVTSTTSTLTLQNSAVLNLTNGVELGQSGSSNSRTFVVAGNGTLNLGALFQVSGNTTTGNNMTLASGFTGTVRITSSASGTAFNPSGGITVNSGTLLVDGTESAANVGTSGQKIVVAPGAVLGGTGTIVGPNSMAVSLTGGTSSPTGATINPGDPLINGGIGKLTINGGLSLNAGSNITGSQAVTLAFDLSSATNYDQLFVSGGTVDLTTGSSGRALLNLNFNSFSGGGVGDFLDLLDTAGSTQANFLLSTGGSSGTTITNGQKFNVNGTDGTYTFAYEYNYAGGGADGTNFGILETNFVAVPEPGTYALLLGGLAMLLIIQSRRRRND